ncbi:hypothetical protein H8959_008876, partial [Pygathrix nigripes]
QPKPHVLDMQGKQSRASFAWHVSDFEDTDRRNSKWATLVRQSKSSLPRASKPFKLPKLPKKEKDLSPIIGAPTLSVPVTLTCHYANQKCPRSSKTPQLKTPEIYNQLVFSMNY